jgi:hypothetical protein
VTAAPVPQSASATPTTSGRTLDVDLFLDVTPHETAHGIGESGHHDRAFRETARGLQSTPTFCRSTKCGHRQTDLGGRSMRAIHRDVITVDPRRD